MSPIFEHVHLRRAERARAASLLHPASHVRLPQLHVRQALLQLHRHQLPALHGRPQRLPHSRRVHSRGVCVDSLYCKPCHL